MTVPAKKASAPDTRRVTADGKIFRAPFRTEDRISTREEQIPAHLHAQTLFQSQNRISFSKTLQFRHVQHVDFIAEN